MPTISFTRHRQEQLQQPTTRFGVPYDPRAEEYEREQGKIRCQQRARNNMRRALGERVVDGHGRSGGRWRREQMSPQREPREVIPAVGGGGERERVAWHRAEERAHWARFQQWREREMGELERRTKREWSALYGRQEWQREQLGGFTFPASREELRLFGVPVFGRAAIEKLFVLKRWQAIQLLHRFGGRRML